MISSDVEMVVAEDAEGAARKAAQLLVEAASAGRHIALSGGSTPRPAYEHAASMQSDWSKAELWWGDERCVPPGDERSNFRLARAALLDRIARLPAVHRVRGELDAEAAAFEYDQELQGIRLGLAFLGIGPDGHTASLFPGSEALGVLDRRAVAAAGPDVDRVTLTPPTLCEAETVAFLAVGDEKAEAVRRAFAGEPTRETPASLIRARSGRTVLVTDRAAAAGLAL
ncbi:MAG: 6-phosphogluconolactonase [Actinobacteria bacterium]|nr:6-phosphogluconolactonase [Actinomycetota bacterium]